MGRWYEVVATPLGAPGENQVAVVFRDVLKKRKAEEALRKSDEKYRSLFEAMGQGYAKLESIRGPDGRAIDVRYLELNPQFERMTGITVAEARGRTVLEMIPDFNDWWIQEYDRILRSGSPGEIEAEVPTLERWYEVKVYPRAGDRFNVLYDEIPVRKKAERALQNREADLARVQRIGEVGGLDINIRKVCVAFGRPNIFACTGCPRIAAKRAMPTGWPGFILTIAMLPNVPCSVHWRATPPVMTANIVSSARRMVRFAGSMHEPISNATPKARRYGSLERIPM